MTKSGRRVLERDGRTVLECEGLSQGYGRQVVLSDLSFALEQGVTVLLGPNGAGKTTLLDTLATLRPPTHGRLRILGHEAVAANHRGIRRAIGYLPQTFGYFGRFTAQEFVEYAAWLKGVSTEMTKKRAQYALSKVGLGEESSKQMRTLSGGMLRRAGIAQAIVHRPQLVILDEPSAGLDPGQRIGLRSLIRELSPKTTFLISTHLVDDLRSLADRVLVLSGGEIAFDGTVEELESTGTSDDAGDSPLERGYSHVLGSN